MKTGCTRRRFLKKAAAASVGWTVLKDSRSAHGAPANERLSLAIVGCGGRGRCFAKTGNDYGAQGNSKVVRVSFLCDVNEDRAADAFRDFPEAVKGNDYRVMLDKFGKEIDLVLVATGDYGHAPASAAAIRAGKHVYCEKPLTVSVREARMLARLASEHKVKTQMGNDHGYDRKAVNMIWSGMLGEVREVYGWCSGAGGGRRPLPAGRQEVPRSLKWDLWLGPAPYREYHAEWMRYLTWREFGTEMLGNRGSHSMATVFKALKIGELWKAPASGPHPIIKVSAECSELCLYTFPKWYRAVWQVPAREGMPPAKVHWLGGELERDRAKLEGIIGRKLDLGGPGETWADWLNSLIVGEKGTLYCEGVARLQEIIPKDKFEGVEPPDLLPKTVGKSFVPGWCEAVLNPELEPMCSFIEFSGPYTEFLHLAHVATLFPGEELEFDPVDCRIVNTLILHGICFFDLIYSIFLSLCHLAPAVP